MKWPRLCNAYAHARVWQRFWLVRRGLPVDDTDASLHDSLWGVGMFRTLADHLRAAWPALAAHAGEFEDLRTTIEHFIQWLELCIDSMTPETAANEMLEKIPGEVASGSP